MELLARLQQILCVETTLQWVDASSRFLASCEGFLRDKVLVVQLAGGLDDDGKPWYLKDIPALLQLANQLADTPDRFTVHVISTGHNWGYGSALAADAKAVILDLSALQRIRFDDIDSGLVTVEPGVTQQMLRDAIDAQHLPFMVPVTGAGPSCSILANALERGYGITPYTDHFAAVNAIKGFLPEGQRYQSSISELDKSGLDAVDKSFKWKVGPYLDGLFTQSGLAIATEMTIRLKRNPAAFDSFYLQFADDQDLEVAADCVQQILLRLEGIVGSVNLMDRRRVLSMMIKNPNGAASHQAMSDQQVLLLAKQHDVPAWTVVGTLYGEPGVVSAGRAVVNQISAGKIKRRIYSEGWMIQLAKFALAYLPTTCFTNIRNMLKSLDNGVAIMKGFANQVALPLAYWRNPRVNADANRLMDPAVDGCGLLWYAPLVQFQPKQLRQLVEHVRRICPRHGIEPMITFTSLRHDTVDSTIPIVFNLQDPAAIADANKCLHELVNEGLKLGLVPYRLNIAQQQHLLDKNTVFWDWANRLKAATDPKQILSQGRYSGH
jgi:4-cresol dehydrogenase (hydroxylating)